MHEHSLAKNLGYIIFNKVNKNKPLRPKKITILIGKASGIDKEFLEHSLKEHIFKGTVCEEAEICFKFETPKIKCKNCSYETEEALEKCKCGSIDFEIVAGKDVYVLDIEF
ncbi:MAG: hydrogenase/urease maturation nickel metallochaperone HypA [Endomicrobia bacterium]|nr:hydrogenase/urease maturation nickel metallochaperone HypA [Endomicrobiia bacterium]